MAALPLPTRISQDSSRRLNQRIQVSTYGDGYEQRAAIGRNSRWDEWALTWNALTLTQRNQLMTFFEQHGLVISWEWTPMNDTAKKWVFADSPVETNSGIYYNISVTVRQVQG